MSSGPAVLKVIVIGDSTVGKTQIMLRFSENVFNPTTTTIGIDFKNKDVDIDGVTYRIQVWDTAGQEKFRNITTSYFRRAHGIALVFDVSKETTFEHVTDWMDSIKANTTSDIPVVLIGNKCDLEKTVKVEDAETLAREFGVPLFWTSALSGDNVSTVFCELAKLIIKSQQGETKPEAEVELEQSHGKKKKDGCC